MTLFSSIKIAWRFLFGYSFKGIFRRSTSNARKSLLGAIFGIGLSLIPLIVVIIVANGMISGITARIVELSSYHVQVVIPRSSQLSDATEVKQDLLNLSDVTNVFFEIQGVGLAAGKTARSGVTIRGVEDSLFDKNPAFRDLFSISSGKLLFDGSNSVVVGKKLAETLELAIGDTMRVITTQMAENQKLIPKISRFTVVGIASSGYQELDALWAFIPFETAINLFSREAAHLFLGVQTNDAYSNKFPSTVRLIDAATPTNYRVLDWQKLHASQYENLKTTKALLILIMFLILLVASVNISSALIMLIMEKRKEIAILKSVGATPQGISVLFIFTGCFTGFCGIVLGVPLGLFFGININFFIQNMEKMLNFLTQSLYTIFYAHSENQFLPIQLLDPTYYLETIPIVISASDILLIAGGTLFLSIVVSFFPAMRAGKEKPLVALQKY
ncbi:MAG: ABC transporter permease [Treponemataceae bacterium]